MRSAAVILGFRGHDEIGSTLIGVLQHYAKELQAHDSRLLLTGVSPMVKAQMDRTGLTRTLGNGGIHLTSKQLGQSLNKALDEVTRWRNTKHS